MRCLRYILIIFILISMATADICICGFESGDTGELLATSGTFSIQTTTTRGNWSTYALRTNPTTTNAGWVEVAANDSSGLIGNANIATAWYRFFFRFATGPSSNDEDIATPAASGQVVKGYLRLNSAGKLAFYDNGPTLQATGTTVLSSNTWYMIELKCGSAGGGHFEVKINGVVEIADQAVSGSLGNNNAGILLGKVINHNGNSVDYFYDDVAISSTGYVGTGQSQVFVPTADGHYLAWTVGAGGPARWQTIKEIPNDGATSFLTSTKVIGDAYTAVVANVTSAAGSGAVINGVKLYGVTDGAGAPSMKYRVRNASTDSDGASFVPPGAFNTRSQALMIANDPGTGSPWVVGNMSAVEVGVVENSTTNVSNITCIYLMVDYVPGVPPALFCDSPIFPNPRPVFRPVAEGWSVVDPGTLISHETVKQVMFQDVPVARVQRRPLEHSINDPAAMTLPEPVHQVPFQDVAPSKVQRRTGECITIDPQMFSIPVTKGWMPTADPNPRLPQQFKAYLLPIDWYNFVPPTPIFQLVMTNVQIRKVIDLRYLFPSVFIDANIAHLPPPVSPACATIFDQAKTIAIISDNPVTLAVIGDQAVTIAIISDEC